MSLEKYSKRLQSDLKLNGLIVRRELCSHIIEKFIKANINVDDESSIDTYVKTLCESLEKQCPAFKSIEQEHINKAIEVCLNRGFDENETIFSVIGAFDFPKLNYDVDRKVYSKSDALPTLLSDADSKAKLFLERYSTVLQRTKRSFSRRQSDLNGDDADRLYLQTVDYLLTVSSKTLDNILILGSLLQIYEGKYYLEDPTGMVQLNLEHATYHGGIFFENCFVLVNGLYEDKTLHVSTMVLPPGEDYQESRPIFGNINYFGGKSKALLRESKKLLQIQQREANNLILFFSDVWLDKPSVLEKLQVLFEGFKENPPIAFVFMGNFLSESYGSEKLDILRKSFKNLSELMLQYDSLVKQSNFIFVPGMNDPTHPHIAPRPPLPRTVTEEFSKQIQRAIFTTNPCRLQYCTKEIVVFRADVFVKMMQGALNKPSKTQTDDFVTRTIVSQGHLSPFALNVLPVHWDWDFTLRLYPLPDLVVIGDRSEPYSGKYKNCNVINPGSFYTTNFSFKSYVPCFDTIDDCCL